MVTLIDADSLCYAAAASTERRFYRDAEGKEYPYKKDVPEGKEALLCVEVSSALWVALANLRKSLYTIMTNTSCDLGEAIVYISGEGNFRHGIDPEYKGNRKTLRVPTYVKPLKDYLRSEWRAISADGLEADDLISIQSRAMEEDHIIAHIDKDLDQIPGWHYNYRTKDIYCVSDDDALKNFYTQVLAGDTIDNVSGIKGIGPKTATKILDGLVGISEIHKKVEEAYLLDGRKRGISDKETIEELEKNCKLLYLLQKDGDEWVNPLRKTQI